MEHNKIEVAVLEDTIVEADTQLQELSELQLAFVGGGNGEVSPY